MQVDGSEFAELGFVTADALFDAGEVGALLDVVKRHREDEPEPNELSSGSMQFTSNLYRAVPAIRALLVDPRVLALTDALMGPDVWCRWDQAVCKGPGAGAFPWHQDNGYTGLAVEHLQIWIALTEATPEQGGLRIEPGGHRRADQRHRWVGSHAELVDAPTATTGVTARPGDVIAFSSRLPHFTAPNRTDRDRWTYVAEFLPLDAEDESVPWPHYVVSRGGRPVGAFEDRP